MPITFSQMDGPSGLPLIRNTFDIQFSRMHLQLEDWAERYGMVYKLRIATNKVVVISSPEIITAVMKLRPEKFVRARNMNKILEEGGVVGVFNAEGEQWRTHRSMINKGLDIKHLNAFFPSMLKKVEHLYNKWSKDAVGGKTIDIQKDFLNFTIDVTTSLSFGYDMNTLLQQDEHIQEQMEKIFPMLCKRLNAPIPWHRLIKSKSDKEFDLALVDIFEQIDDFIEQGRERLKNNPNLQTKPENLLDALIHAAESENCFSSAEIRGNLMTLLLAGEDTTAHTMAWSIYLLTKHPKWMDWLEEEANEIIGEHRWIQEYSQVSKLMNFNALAHETLRIKPVVPLLVFEPIENIEIHGYQFEKGMHLIINSRFATTKDSYFSEAKSFNPSRWVKESQCPVHNVKAFIPFGFGPRYCPGKNLAMLQINLVLSMLFKNFIVELDGEHKDITEILAFTMMASDFKVSLKKRATAITHN